MLSLDEIYDPKEDHCNGTEPQFYENDTNDFSNHDFWQNQGFFEFDDGSFLDLSTDVGPTTFVQPEPQQPENPLQMTIQEGLPLLQLVSPELNPCISQSQFCNQAECALNFQPCNPWFANSNQKNNSFGIHHRNPKRKVDLLENQQSFKNSFYSKIDDKKKKFPKKYVKDIHEKVLMKYIEGFKKMEREEFRRIDLYFQNYAPYREQILNVLTDKKEWILENILSNN